jgi:hypothetical protein
MGRITRGSIVLFVAALISFCLFVGLLFAKPWGPITRQVLSEQKVYAYRGWQSTGYTVSPGDQITIQANGNWLYSPVADFHGPEGHRVYRAPSFYPVPGVNGGALIGKVGESGTPFYIGRYGGYGGYYRGYSSDDWQEMGTLYLRINDDLLGDNKGFVTARLEIEHPESHD